MPVGGAGRGGDGHRHRPLRREEARSAASSSPLRGGTPAHDHLGDILATLDAEAFQRCFVAWVAALTGAAEGVVAIDGKTVAPIRKGGKDAIHMVSAFAARQRLVLGQVKVADKANEIVAIPKLLDMLAIEGAVVTIDAMGCQRAIAQKIVDKKADYILALKGNQGALRQDVELFVAEQKARDFNDTTVSRADHGRWRSRPHRDPRDHRHPRHRLATTTTRLARLEKRHHGRKPPGNVRCRQGHQRLSAKPASTSLRWFPRPTSGAPRARSLGRREQPPLGLGHGLPRRRMPPAHRPCPRQLHHPQAHGPKPHSKSQTKNSIRLRRKVAAWDDEFLVSLRCR